MTDAAAPSNVTELHPDDPVQLRPNGTVFCQIAGKRYRLRRPKMGEYRRLRESLQDMTDALDDALEHVAVQQARIRTRQSEMSERHATGELTDAEQAEWMDLRLQDRNLGREASRMVEQRRLEWLAEAWAMLSMDGPLPDDPDEAEAWLLDTQLANKLLQHWRTTPFVSGGR